MLRMEIDLNLTEGNRRRLRQALGPGVNVDEIAELVARAGARELVAQATGEAAFSSIADLRSYRIFCLIEQGLGLDDAEGLVAAIFKVPPATAKRLVSSAVARYKVDLEDRVVERIVSLLDEATWTEDKRWEVQIPSTFVRDRIAETLSRVALPDPQSAQRGPIWKFADETYQALRKESGLEPRSIPE